MFRYYVRLAMLGIRRNPVLSGLMVAAIAVGIGACITMLNIEHVMARNPIPHRSDLLYYVQVDNWDPYESWDTPNLPPDQVTYRDGTALLAARQARRQVLSHKSSRVVQPGDPDLRPFQVTSRSTSADFFAMFDAPFLYGSGWNADDDASEAYVAVIDKATNETLFGGANSVGRDVVMNGQAYRITGVLDDWNPMPKFYDLSNDDFGAAEEVYFPLSVSIANDIGSSGNTNCWKPPDGTDWESFRNSECVWLQFWVELHGADEREAYLSFLDSYVASQKETGRFPRPMNNRLSDVETWLEADGVVVDDVRILVGLAGLFLVVCLLNTIGLILAKVLRRAGDISLRRALGASRRAVFAQYVVEAGVIGLAGGLLGIGLSWAGLNGIRGLFGENRTIEHVTGLDWSMVGAAVVLAIASALAAALYPTWRACRIAPAMQLKSL